MDAATITQLIGSLGFPIAACIALFWYLQKEREDHAEEISQLRQILEKNTNILTELYTYLKEVVGDGKH